jgi:hypothetical protein
MPGAEVPKHLLHLLVIASEKTDVWPAPGSAAGLLGSNKGNARWAVRAQAI